jgi:malate dehydrogenase (quinone)
MTTPLPNHSDVILVGAGIMSATLAVFLKELDPGLKMELYEVLGSAAQESSDAWNNAGTGHAALCVVFKEGADTHFIPDPAAAAGR